MENIYRFYMPECSISGCGCVSSLGDEIISRGYKHCLVVTDVQMARTAAFERVLAVLDAAGITRSIFDGVTANPTVRQVERALDLLREADGDCVVTVGGGSPHDCGKAAAILAANGGCLADYQGVNRSEHRGLPLFAVNTTAGTASEITTTYVITDTDSHTKMIFEDKNCLAVVAVNDPELMLSLPSKLTASTGMDALTHAVECYVSSASFPLANSLALIAVTVIAEHLERAVTCPGDIAAREGMANGQTLAGMAFGNGGVGLVHAMAHALGGVYDLPHGLCNAILLGHVIKYNSSSKAAAARYAALYRAICPEAGTVDDREAANRMAEWTRELSEKVGTNIPLKTLGVKPEDLAALADKTLSDDCAATNPVMPSKEDIIKIYLQAM